MPKFKVELSADAAKFYERADRATRLRLDRALNAIAEDPFDVRHHDIQPLHGPLKGLWRYRVGNLRVVYRPDKVARKVFIVAIRPRGKAYRMKGLGG